MNTQFTSKQKEIIARRLGYEGPMQGFDEFVASSPALQRKYNMVTDKFIQRMAKGGMVRKYADGGAVPSWLTPPDPMQPVTTAFTTYTNPVTGEQFTAPTGGYTVNVTAPVQTGPVPTETTKGTPRPMGTTFTDVGGVPQAGGAAQATTARIQPTPAQTIGTESIAPSEAAAAAPSEAAAATAAPTPTAMTAAQIQAAGAAPAVTEAMQAVQPATGVLSQQAQVQAAAQAPDQTALQSIEAAQLGAAQQVVSPAARAIQEGELVEGTAVSQQRVQQALEQSQAEAAQGVVTEDMTTQGQLNKILANFDAGNPPAWAAGAMRNATAVLASRGLGASSLAGQAVIQAAIESALPIASQDAQVFQQMGLQNLSNKQQMAVLAAQQRAAFLQQEFDQTFQTRVTNAARISEIANLNFSAEQQVALENARLAQSVDLANLSNDQAVVMAKAAQIASLETTNLNNRQQAAVVNAQAFLQMDMQNIANEQQTALFKAQQITNTLLSDTAAENAARQFNATSQSQTDQFMANLTAQVNQFNVAQKNAINQFNTDQINSIRKFNAEAQNERDKFNSAQRLVIDQANAQWLRDVSTANTAAQNATNYLNAQLLSQMTLQEYNNEIQLYRDQIEMAWSSFEKMEDRATSIINTQVTATGSLKAAEAQADGDLWGAVAQLGIELFKN